MSPALAMVRGVLATLASLVLGVASAQGPKGVLELVSGERIEGRLATAEGEKGFAWDSPVFRTPLVFEPTALSRVTFEAEAATWAGAGAYRVFLTNGDLILGDLMAIDAESVSLATARHGSLRVPRASIVSLRRRSGGSTVYQGPTSVLEWRDRRAEASQWRAVDSSLTTAVAGGELFQDGLLAADCRVECALSWTGKPSFRMVIGCGAEPATDASAVIVEAWEDVLVAFREREDRVDLVELQTPLRDTGSTTLRFEVRAHQVVLFDAASAELGKLERANAAAGIAVQLGHGGELRLDRLRLERLYGAGETAPRSVPAAEVRGYDAAAGVFEVGEARVEAATVDAVVFDADPPPAPEPSGQESAAGAELLLQDGTRLSGDYAGISGRSMLVRTPWAPEPIATTVDGMKVLRLHGNTKPRFQEQFKLALGEDRFLGKIVGWSAEDGTLLWQPTLGNRAAVLQSRDDLRLDLARASAYFVNQRDYPHRILFVNHDCVPCKVVEITPQTVTFLEPFAGSRRQVAASLVKALELDPKVVARVVEDQRVKPVDPDKASRRSYLLQAAAQRPRHVIDAGRRDTILSLPRKYKGSPPTHLVIAANGDVMRGVLAGVTEQAIHLEMSLTSDATLPRDKVVAMVFFHPDPKPADPKSEPAAPPSDKELVLEVTLDTETRLTLSVVSATPKVITGRSSLVGEVTIPYEDIVSMVSGGLRGQAPGFFSGWQLTPMKEPPH